MKIAGTHLPIWLVILYLLALFSILAWPISAFGSVFMFDAPGSENMPSTYVAVAIALCYPILPLAGVLGSFLSYRRAHKIPAYVLAGLAILPFIAFGLILISGPLTTIYILLGGKF